MDKTIQICKITVVVFLMILSVVMFIMIDDHAVKYDCNILMGGWHPDVPAQVQEKCRKGTQT
jgi:hypothetical protein